MSSTSMFELVHVNATSSASSCDLVQSTLSALEGAILGDWLLLAVISLVGSARSGKSTLGNSIADVLRSISPSSTWADEVLDPPMFATSASLGTPCTQGLQLILIPWGRVHGRPAAVILLDSAGAELGSTRHEQLLLGLQSWLSTQVIHVSDGLVTYRAIHSVALTVSTKLAALQGQTPPLAGAQAVPRQPLLWPSLLVVANKVTLDRQTTSTGHDAHWRSLLADSDAMPDVVEDKRALLRAYPQSQYRTVPLVQQRADAETGEELLIDAVALSGVLDAIQLHPQGVSRTAFQWSRLPNSTFPPSVDSLSASFECVNLSDSIRPG